MAVSNNPDLVVTAADIIRDAYAELNLYGVDENISPADTARGFRVLNRLVKKWQAQQYHLWLKQTVALFTKQNQSLYTLSSSSTDHASDTYYETTLAADAVSGASSIVVTSATNITVGDYIGVILDDNDIFWGTVDGVVTTTVTFTSGQTLPSAASSGKAVYNYTDKLDTPLNVYSAVRRIGNRDIPMNFLSYEEYFELPNKDDPTNTPVSYNYDRQRNSAVIRLWPMPDNSTVIVKLTISRRIYIFEANSNNPDFPEEWSEPLVLNVAVKLAPAFGKNKGETFTALKMDAQQALKDVLEFDNEPGSIYFQPNFRNG